GDRITDMTHSLSSQGRMRCHLHWRAVLGMDHPATNQISDLVAGKLFAGEHGDYAGHCLGGRNIDALDLRVSVRRADKDSPGLTRPDNVVGVLALTGNKAEVFFSAHRRADTRRAHGGLLPLKFFSIRRLDASRLWPLPSLLPQWL